MMTVYAHATTALCRIHDMITPLTLEEQQTRSIDVLSPEPDFLATIRDDQDPELPIETACDTSNFHNFIRFAHMVFLSPKPHVPFPGYSVRILIDVLHNFFRQNPGFILKTYI